MKNLNAFEPQIDGVREIHEDEVFEIFSLEMKSNYAAPPARVVSSPRSVYKSRIKLPGFTNEENEIKMANQSLLQEIVILEEEIKFLKINNTQLSTKITDSAKNTETTTATTKGQLSALEAELTARQNQIELLKIEIKRNQGLYDVQLKQTTNEKVNFANENRQLKQTIENLNQRLSDLTTKEMLLTNSINELIRSQESAATENEKLMIKTAEQTKIIDQQVSSISNAFAANEALTAKFLALTNELTAIKATLSETENNYVTSVETIKTMSSEAVTLQFEINDLQTLANEKDSQLKAAVQAHANEITESKTTYTLEMAQLKQSHSAEINEMMNATKTEAERNKLSFTEEIQTLKIGHAAGVQKIEQSFIDETQTLKATHAAQLQNLAISHSTELQNISATFTAEAQSAEESYALAVAKLKQSHQDEVQTFSAEVLSLKAEIAAVIAQNTALAKDLAQKEAQFAIEHKAAQERVKKLNSYFVQIEQTKMQFQKALTTLNGEIKEAIQIHPLKDYYNLTCKEVVRVEIELKKTPTSAPQRRPLEKVMEQLIMQREYLKGVISQHETNLTKKQTEIGQLSQSLSVFDVCK